MSVDFYFYVLPFFSLVGSHPCFALDDIVTSMKIGVLLIFLTLLFTPSLQTVEHL